MSSHRRSRHRQRRRVRATSRQGSGPLALCLHGFPDSAWTYRHLLPALADAGFRAVAPLMRGYAPTAVPADGRYQTGALGLDACALHEALGGDGDAVIIGHDWGAMATYTAANHEPDRWRRVVTMAVPPAGAVGAGFMQYRQLKKSWYMFFFQHGLSDVVVGMDDLAFIDGLWADWSPGYDGAEDLAHVKDALRDPANLAAALGYYRATLGGRRRRPGARRGAGGRVERPPRSRRCTCTAAPTAAWASRSPRAPRRSSRRRARGSRSSTAPGTSSTSRSPTR